MSFKLYRAGAAGVAVVLVLAAASQTFAQTQIIASTGGTAPGSGGTAYTTFNNQVVLTNTGEVFFTGQLFGGNNGIWHYDGTNLNLVARHGMVAPDTNGSLYDFSPFGLALPFASHDGTVAFNAGLQTGGTVTTSNHRGFWITDGGTLTLLARTGEAAPGTAETFATLGNNPRFSVDNFAFTGTLVQGGTVASTNDAGLWLQSGGSVALIAREGSVAPGTGGATFDTPSLAAVNDLGEITFTSFLQSGGTVTVNNDAGLWTTIGGTLAMVARKGEPAPGTVGSIFQGLSGIRLNNAGDMVFAGQLVLNVGDTGLTNDAGFWIKPAGGSVSLLVREGDTTPAGGVFSGFNAPIMNEHGNVAFRAFYGAANGLFTNVGGTLKHVMGSGTVAPHTGGATYTGLIDSSIHLNSNGQLAYVAHLILGGTVNGNNSQGIWITGPNGETLLVARAGDVIQGATIGPSGLAIASNTSGGEDGFRTRLNNYGQIAYYATLTGGSQGVFLFTPELHWRTHIGVTPTTGPSEWDNANKWTITQLPAHVHNVYIDPENSVTIGGPAGDVTVKSLTLGGGAGDVELNLNAGATINVLENFNIAGSDVTLGIELFGDAINDYGRISILGDAMFAGTLNISLNSGFTPTGGEVFDLFDFAGVLAPFDLVNLQALTGGLSWNTSALYTLGQLSIDGGVQEPQPTPQPLPQPTPQPAPSGAVPEPVTGLMILVAIAGLARRRTRTRC